MPRIEFAQKAVIIDGDHVLMVRKSNKDPHNPERWELPGGRHKGTEDLDEHLRREVREETGLIVEPGELIDLWSWEMDWNGEPVKVIAVSRFCYLADTAPVAPHREADDFLDGQAWYPRSALLSLDIIPTQVRTIKMVVER